MPSYNIQDGNEGFKRFKVNGSGTNEDPYIPIMSVKVDPDVTSETSWGDPLSDENLASEKLVKETIDNQEVTAASFDTTDGVLTLTKTDGNITVNLDGRFLENIVEDTTPQLGGELDLNSNNITGTGDIDITGEITAITLIGNMQGATIFEAKAGEALTEGDPVYISGDDITGNKPIVSIADADDANKMPCFGLAAETVSINANVNVVTFGTLSGLDTSSYNQGDILYISTTGTLTATKPSGESSLIQNIGKVIRSHASAGSIKVGGAGRTNDVPNLNNGNVFIGNASNQAETRGLTLDDIAETTTNKHFTADDETKLDSIETGAEVNVNADWDAISGDEQILNKPTDITDLSTHNVTELADITSAGSGSIITTAERTKLSGTPFAIWAEETADLNNATNSGFQWSFGNGNMTPSGTGIVLPFACNLIAISLSTEGLCTVEVEVYKNTSGTGESVSLTSANSGYTDLESSPISYAAGDIVNFYTVVGDTASNGGVVTAWFTRV
jgi:hypothetical protein